MWDPTGQHRSILLVDDQPFVLSANAEILRAAGHTVHTCEQWTGVVHTLQEETPDLILLDCNMPTLKEDQLRAILRLRAKNPMAKIMMFSSESGELLKNVDGYIPKDVPRDQLLVAIEGALATIRWIAV